ncbi:MAG TPA: hypothetical protein VGL64_16370 [Amycolatopsis sp.]
MTVQLDRPREPGIRAPQRVDVAGCFGVEDPRPRVATPEEMIAAAAKVLAGRGHGRHRKPDTRDGLLCRVADRLSRWAAALRVALLLAAGGCAMAAVVTTTNPRIAASLGTFVAFASVVGACAVWPRRTRVPRR